MMKKRIVAGLLLAGMVALMPGGGKAANENYINQDNIEADLLVVIAEKDDNNLIGYSLVDGHTWYLDKKYDLGDIVTTAINNNGTDNKNDDVIVSDVKAGSVKCELSKDKKVVEWFSFNGGMYNQEDYN